MSGRRPISGMYGWVSNSKLARVQNDNGPMTATRPASRPTLSRPFGSGFPALQWLPQLEPVSLRIGRVPELAVALVRRMLGGNAGCP
jgi:hypothetical protein